MKKWSGGMLIVALATILIFRYSLIGTNNKVAKLKKQKAYDFFHPMNETLAKNTTIGSPSPQRRVKTSKKKPHFINYNGLDDLYALPNMSAQEYMPLLVWSQMHVLLSRSDVLPETAKGITEASIAWKNLSSIINDENLFNIHSVMKEDENCPSFVDRFSKRRSNTGSVLELPCGLIEDSAVTLIGIPYSGQGSFQIDFIGLPSSMETSPPLILHCNVSLPGNNMTMEPYIIQNTWTDELGWGKEERCPAHGSFDAVKVDGLALCNEQVAKGTVADNQSASPPNNEILTNSSRESSHASANFPFVEGTLFTATVLVGLGGFHMTVNGRQETSFGYREKLEPWLVNQVKVSGNVDILSMMAKGLPVSEDHDLIVNAKHLKAPPISRRRRIVMLVGVFSTGNNFERRMALRRSWMQYDVVRSGDVAIRFFIGLHKSMRVNLELWKEAQAYGDIQFMPFVDYYSLITYKTIAICLMGTKILPAKYIMKTDDDAFVRIDEVLSLLKGKSSNGLLCGLISFESSPHRDEGSKWYISEKEWPKDSYPPWAHGPGYVISRDIAKFIVQGHQEGDLQLFKLEDVAMGIWIDQFKQSGQEVNYINDERFFNAGCESNYILAHYQGPRKLLCLWEKLQKEHQPNCCE